MTYLVTAIVQDNQENTMKVCARVERVVDAGRGVLESLIAQTASTEEAVKETWAVHSLFIELI